MSATEGQRPGNYLSCSSCWIFYLIYALSTSTNRANPNYLLVYFIIIYHFIYHAIYLPIILSHYLSSHLSLSLYIYLPIHLSLTISNRQSINQYSIAADLGAGIGLVPIDTVTIHFGVCKWRTGLKPRSLLYILGQSTKHFNIHWIHVPIFETVLQSW